MGDEDAPLPIVDEELVSACVSEYEAIFRSGSQAELGAARFRMVWSLVHSTNMKHVDRGAAVARGKLEEIKNVALRDYKEFAFLLSVACYRTGKYVEARRLLKKLLEAHPDFHQADTLKARVDEQIVHQGLWGVGVGTAVLGIGLAVLLGSGSRK